MTKAIGGKVIIYLVHLLVYSAGVLVCAQHTSVHITHLYVWKYV